MTKTDASWIAFAQKLITARKIMNPFQLHKVLAEEYPSKVVSYATAQAAAKKLTFAPGGRNYSPAQKLTADALAGLQMEINENEIGSAYALARNPRAQELGISMSALQNAISAKKLTLAAPLPKHNKLIAQLLKNFSEGEIKMLLRSGKMRVVPGLAPVPVIDFSGERIRFAAMGDSHFGSIYHRPEMWDAFVKVLREEKPDFVTHDGDVTDGHCHKQAHKDFSEWTHIGFEKQKREAVGKFKRITDLRIPIYFISGNHDRFFQKSNGADICRAIAKELDPRPESEKPEDDGTVPYIGPLAKYLGHDEGNISLKGKAVLKLWHGEDGNSYAIDYRVNKIVEAFTGGEKPHILLLGHTHKMIYCWPRMVHSLSCGALSLQSSWMRGKRIANHAGFWMVDAWVNKDGVAKVAPTWYPLYF